MSKWDCCEQNEPGTSSVNVTVNVTKIVKYACITGIIIVGIIFGTRYDLKMKEKELQ